MIRAVSPLPPGLVPALRAGLARLYGERLARAVLFGSYARGEATPESDLDVLVVLRGEVDRAAEAWRLSELTLELYAFDLSVSFVVMEEETFLRGDWPLLTNVRREGIELAEVAV